MYRSRLTLSLLLSSSLAMGCSDDSPVAPEGPEPVVRTATVSAPRLTQLDLEPSTVTGQGPGPGPADPATVTMSDEAGDRSLAQIFDSDTRVWFDDGFVGFFGRHDYIGNVGRIRTTGHVTFNDQHLGSQSARRQDYTPFLLDLGRRKNIWVYPKVYTDHQCGLDAMGDSEHAAWWEFYQGDGVATWGRSERSSQSDRASQGACAGGTGGYEADREESEGLVCTYWITYDMATGEILDAELLFCAATGGNLI